VRQLLTALFAALALQCASAAADLMEGVDYVRIEPMPVADSGRIEVIEFFYYGCGACYRFQAHLSRWLQRLPPDVDFRRAPALRQTAWIPLTRLYLTLLQLDLLPQLHAEVYRAFHEQDRSLQTRDAVVSWAREQGVDPVAFERLLLSDATLIATQQARDATIAYGIRNTPSLVVDGRFLTSSAMLGDVARIAPVLDELLVMARESR
jgi:protein dithiol oxidoreductase (disulfide-forming)